MYTLVNIATTLVNSMSLNNCFLSCFPSLFTIILNFITPLCLGPLRRPQRVSVVMGSTRSDGSATTGKERLRWTQQLHDRFVEAVNRLGGPDSKSFALLVVE